MHPKDQTLIEAGQALANVGIAVELCHDKFTIQDGRKYHFLSLFNTLPTINVRTNGIKYLVFGCGQPEEALLGDYERLLRCILKSRQGCFDQARRPVG